MSARNDNPNRKCAVPGCALYCRLPYFVCRDHVGERVAITTPLASLAATVAVLRSAGLAQDSQGRKDQPIFRGVIRYFPDALAEVAELSRLGNEKHNPGQPLHWARSKSGDELDCVARHLAECLDADGNSVWIEGEYSKPVRHLAALVWRSLAALQKQIEQERGDGKISPGSKP